MWKVGAVGMGSFIGVGRSMLLVEGLMEGMAETGAVST
jgi:hypothetical protein